PTPVTSRRPWYTPRPSVATSARHVEATWIPTAASPATIGRNLAGGGRDLPARRAHRRGRLQLLLHHDLRRATAVAVWRHRHDRHDSFPAGRRLRHGRGLGGPRVQLDGAERRTMDR